MPTKKRAPDNVGTTPSKQRVPENVGAINPYALAEVMLKRKVNWKRVNQSKTLERALGMEYPRLFDPKNESPLYTGLALNRKTLTMARAPVPRDAAGVPGAMAVARGGATWADAGDFFKEAAEMDDPIQGALGDCYFISAMASVAWSRPYLISHRTRATGPGPDDFVDMVEFYRGGKAEEVEVTELLPLTSPGGGFIYARSIDGSEVWPAIYEKAYAKWRTNDPGDQPAYDPIAGGDPVGACATLTGMTPFYYWTADIAVDDIWSVISDNCVRKKTVSPMTAWTYPSGDAAPDHVDYNTATLAANHAYSILGCELTTTGDKYVILRNPWGTYEASLNVLGGEWVAWDAPYKKGSGWWRTIDLATSDGIFALSVATFKQYYQGFGVAK